MLFNNAPNTSFLIISNQGRTKMAKVSSTESLALSAFKTALKQQGYTGEIIRAGKIKLARIAFESRGGGDFIRFLEDLAKFGKEHCMTETGVVNLLTSQCVGDMIKDFRATHFSNYQIGESRQITDIPFALDVPEEAY
jgi:hypothetical protein